MAARLWSVGQMIDRILRKVEGSEAFQSERDAVLDDLQETFDYYVSYGNRIGDSGWVWMVATETVTITASGNSIAPVVLPSGVPLTLRLADGASYPISLFNGDPRHFAAWTSDRTSAGTPQVATYASYNPVTDLYTVTLYPIPTVGSTIEVVMQRQSSELFDSYALADSVLCPAHLRHGLMKGTIAQREKERPEQYAIAIRERDEWLEMARSESDRRKPPAQIVVDTEANANAGRASEYARYWGWQ